MMKTHRGFLPLNSERCPKQVVHCIAQDRACGAGFAAQLPEEHLADLRACPTPSISDFIVTNNGKVRIAHLITKAVSSDKPTRVDFTTALLKFTIFALEENNLDWHCPMIGAGLDKLSWTETEGLLAALPLICFHVWVPEDNPIRITK